jgi:UDP-2,3-diacylglucosamine pyrophosphatase LpxH|tara:strand:+ start:384 stop:1217 length:834 start_codon:yes stop_codon:yes gene_type:complete
MKRLIEILVISDIHLGTYGCQSKALLNYLKSVDPKIIILNGDIIDIWQFNKRYFPKSHMKIIKYFLNLIQDGKTIYYLTGNHDEMLRKFNGFELKNFKILNKKVINLNGHQAWFFHGDVFDLTMQYSKWLTRLGAIGYDALILINSALNFILSKLGRPRYSLSKKVKNSVKGAVKFINKFEETVVGIAFERKYKFVVCGHIHQPAIKKHSIKNKNIIYLNSGDWVENLTSLEYHNKKWTIYQHDNNLYEEELVNDESDLSAKELFQGMLKEFKIDQE